MELYLLSRLALCILLSQPYKIWNCVHRSLPPPKKIYTLLHGLALGSRWSPHVFRGAEATLGTRGIYFQYMYCTVYMYVHMYNCTSAQQIYRHIQLYLVQYIYHRKSANFESDSVQDLLSFLAVNFEKLYSTVIIPHPDSVLILLNQHCWCKEKTLIF